MSNDPVATPPLTVGEDKTVAVLSYITIVGFIVAIILFSSKKTALGGFHLRQVLGLILASIAAAIVLMICAFILAFIPVIGLFLVIALEFIVWIGFLILAILGLVGAIQGTMKPVPILGAKIQELLKGVFI